MHKLVDRLSAGALGALAVLAVVLCGTVQASAQEVPLQLSATHQVVAVETDADGSTWVTLELTVTNDSDVYLREALLRVMPGMGFVPMEMENGPDLGDLAAGASVTVTSTGQVVGPVTADDPILSYLMFTGEATDDTGAMIGFPVESVGKGM